MENIVSVQLLTKKFKKHVKAVDELNWTVPQGVVCGLLGRNGAGKTTLLRMLASVLHPNSGQIDLFGKPLLTLTEADRQRFFYVGQENHPEQAYTLRQLCRYVACFYPNWNWETTQRLAETFKIDPDARFATLSGGQKRAAYLVVAFSTNVELLILDEPAAALDPIARKSFSDCLIDALGDTDGSTVILSTHIVSDLERTADHIAIMDKGRMLVSSPRDELQQSHRRVQIIFASGTVPGDFSVPSARRVKTDGAVYAATVDESAEETLGKLATQDGITIHNHQNDLEEIFLEYAGEEE